MFCRAGWWIALRGLKEPRFLISHLPVPLICYGGAIRPRMGIVNCLRSLLCRGPLLPSNFNL